LPLTSSVISTRSRDSIGAISLLNKMPAMMILLGDAHSVN
jgi:hypothetical protein